MFPFSCGFFGCSTHLSRHPSKGTNILQKLLAEKQQADERRGTARETDVECAYHGLFDRSLMMI